MPRARRCGSGYHAQRVARRGQVVRPCIGAPPFEIVNGRSCGFDDPWRNVATQGAPLVDEHPRAVSNVNQSLPPQSTCRIPYRVGGLAIRASQLAAPGNHGLAPPRRLPCPGSIWRPARYDRPEARPDGADGLAGRDLVLSPRNRLAAGQVAARGSECMGEFGSAVVSGFFREENPHGPCGSRVRSKPDPKHSSWLDRGIGVSPPAVR